MTFLNNALIKKKYPILFQKKIKNKKTSYHYSVLSYVTVQIASSLGCWLLLLKRFSWVAVVSTAALATIHPLSDDHLGSNCCAKVALVLLKLWLIH